VLQGKDYQMLRGKWSADAASAPNKTTRDALRSMIEHLDDAMESSLKTTDPRLVGQYADTRKKYRNSEILLKASQSDHVRETGKLTPDILADAVESIVGSKRFRDGQHDFGFVNDAQRLRIGKNAPPYEGPGGLMGEAVGGLAGLTAGYLAAKHAGNPEGLFGMFAGTGIGGLMGNATKRSAHSVMTNPLMQKWMSNNALSPEHRGSALNPNVAQRLLMFKALQDYGTNPPAP
jgi:hypothetical protein